MKNSIERLMTASSVSRTTCLAIAFMIALFFGLIGVTDAQQMGIKVVSLTSPVSPGNPASIIIKTVSNARCRITVQYLSGPSKAKGLVPKAADSQGQVTWTWLVGTRTTPGTWPIVVNCSNGQLQGNLKTSFTVQ